ncbi:MAG: DnaJ domain-containing protein [Nitrospirae bacterium]|nr:DnaJ domain-containing protein [Nitrospirota bacterium]
MKNRRNYYRVLQVQPDAPFEVIRASYKAIMLELKQHPDLGGEKWKAQVINEAYESLKDEAKRREYDKMMLEKYTNNTFSNSGINRALKITSYCSFCKRPLSRDDSSKGCCPTCKSPLKKFGVDQFERECKRSGPRIKKSDKFYYYTTWPQKGNIAEMIDLSRNGIRFKCFSKLSHGMFIKISGSWLKGIVKINNASKSLYNGETEYIIGAEFVSVTFKETRGVFYSATA